jgi:hypothetical protein
LPVSTFLRSNTATISSIEMQSADINEKFMTRTFEFDSKTIPDILNDIDSKVSATTSAEISITIKDLKLGLKIPILMVNLLRTVRTRQKS